jgi:hypothetical protein
MQNLRALSRIVTGCCLLVSFTASAYDGNSNKQEDCSNVRQFTFSWQFIDQCGMKPRGGTSTGGGLVLDKEPHSGWLALQESGLNDKERDRRAILAMAGPYRTSFDFLEVVGYTPDFTPDPPYQSWGTEYVYVVEDTENFISLQHIMVMVYEDKDGKVSEPFVQKHWRQDWQYQKRDILVFAGEDTFTHKKYGRSEVKGTWAQAVYQVDDSPRYEAIGKWEHKPNFSTWISNETWRPIPRRESSFRKDYDVLIGTNRHTITPTGWVQEEENYKTVLEAAGKPKQGSPYLSKELGVNRYERLKDFDFSAGDKYWELTGDYWRDVREVWEDIKSKHREFGMKESVDGLPLFMPFFSMAQEVYESGQYNSKDGKQKIEKMLTPYIN